MIKQIGKYEIKKQIGSGAMGAVYEAIDPLIQRKVAIKTLKSEFLTSDGSNLLKRFRQEAQAIGQLHHPNIVAIFEYGKDEELGGYFIAMTFVEGKDLKKYFDSNEKFNLEAVCHIIIQLLDALGFTHKQNIYHRDIKPSNLILKPDGTVMVTDFGIASLENSDLTQDSTLMGTPSYLSPEQLKGQSVDGRTDLYSTAVILYQFLTGEKPFQGSTIAAIYHKILEVEPVPPSSINDSVPETFDRIITKGLAKNREERYSNAQDFKKDIQVELDRLITDRKDDEASLGGIDQDDLTVVLPLEEVQNAIADNRGELFDTDATTYLAPDAYDSGPEEVKSHQETSQSTLSKKKPATIEFFSKYRLKVLGSIGFAMFLIVSGVTVYYLKGKNNIQADQPLIVSEPAVEGGEGGEHITPTTEVRINTEPSGAKIFIDDIEQKSLTNYRAQLDAKQYLLSIRKEGYHEVIVVLDVNVGKPVNLDIQLHPF